MADVNKTVDIAVKADMKQLLNEFKKMPGMTAKEAKKMVSMLEREFKNAEKAAKQAADQQAKAMKKIGDTAKQSSKEIRQMKRSSQEMGGALQATGDIIGELDPALGGLVATLSIAGTAVRDLGKALLTGNPYILGAVVAAGAAAAAYSYFNQETQLLDSSQSNATIAMNNANAAILQQEQSARNAAAALSSHKNSVEDLQFEYDLLSGAVTEFDSDMRKAKRIVKEQQEAIVEAGAEQNAANRQAIETQKKVIETQQKHLSNLEATGKRFIEGTKESDAYRHHVMLLTKAEENLGKLEKKRADDNEAFSNQAAEQLVQTEEILKKTAELRKQQREEAEQQRKNSEYKAKQAKREAKAKAEEAKRNAEIAKEEQRLNGISNKLLDARDQAREQSDSINIQNQKIKISMMDTELEKINELAKFEQSQTQNKIAAIEKEKAGNLALAENEEQLLIAKLANKELDAEIEALKEQAFLKDMVFSNQRMEALDKEKQKRIELVESIVSQSVQGMDAVSQIIKNVSGENKEAAMIAFRVNQASAIANIAMTTAQKIMEVAPNPFAIAGVTALGALQAGVVATQPPPEFHMGGVIDKGEDTRNITVLTGEAVLDRRTVQRIGGDPGVARLQRGEMPNREKVIVMNPFKHFDRYAMASSKRGGVMNRFSNNKAAGDY
jgi:hypothetical protein